MYFYETDVPKTFLKYQDLIVALSKNEMLLVGFKTFSNRSRIM